MVGSKANGFPTPTQSSTLKQWKDQSAKAADDSGLVRRVTDQIRSNQRQSSFGSTSNPCRVSSQRLKAYAKENNVSSFAVVQLAFAMVLSLYGNTEQPLFVSVWPEDASSASSAYPVQAQVDAASSIADALKDIDEQNRQRLPTSALGDDEGLRWGASVKLLHEGTTEAANFPTPSSSFHVSFGLQADRVTLQYAYSTETLVEQDARYLADRIASVLDKLVAQTSQRTLGEIDLFLHGEKSLILDQYSHSAKDPKKNLFEMTHQYVSHAADRFGSAVAVETANGTKLTYQQLEQRSDILALKLCENGVEPEQHVALYLDKSELLPISILSILKAGACVTPLGLDSLPERNQFILQDTKVSVMIVDSESAAKGRILAQNAGAEILVLDVSEVLASITVADPKRLRAFQLCQRGHHKAYTIYTSGTTGTPKAVILEHRNLVSFLNAEIDGWKLGPGDKLLQFSAAVWDVSVGDFLFSLTSGATMFIQHREELINNLDATLTDKGITHAVLTPTVASLITAKPAALGALIVTGEPLPVPLRDHLTSIIPVVINGGAPSEVTILALLTRLDSQSALRWSPFGKPIGAVGELCLSGAQVCRGYLNQAEKTAQVFVPNAFQSDDDDRMYRTGDLARLHADGQFELLGRIDGQIKFHGIRLESEEIERALIETEDGEVLKAVVAVQTIHQVSKLVAYLVFQSHHQAGNANLVAKSEWSSASKLVQRVQKSVKLSGYAIPTAFVCLGDIPTTATGKTDRRATVALFTSLPDAEQQEALQAMSGKPLSATLTANAGSAMEAKVQQCYVAALGMDVQHVAIDQPFASLGGDSLATTRLISKLSHAGIAVSIRQLVENTTVASLAASVSGPTEVEKIDKTKALLSGSEAQWILWRYGLNENNIDSMYLGTFFQLVSATLGYSMRTHRAQSIEWNQLVIECRGQQVEVGRLRAAYTKITELHTSLRTAIAFTQTFKVVLVVMKPGHFDTEVIAFHPCDDKEHDRMYEEYMRNDRHRGHTAGIVPSRLGLIGATANRTQRLIWSFPHSVSDGWSLANALSDLTALLNGRTEGVGEPTDFRSYAEIVQGRDLDANVEWWKQHLLPMPTPKWPINFDKTPDTKPVSNLQFDTKCQFAFEPLSKARGVSPFAAAMTAFLLALWKREKLAGNGNVMTTSYVSGARNFHHVSDLDRLVGPTLDLMYLKAEMRETLSAVEMIRKVQTELDKGKGREHVSRFQLLEQLGLKNFSSITQTALVFQNLPVIEFEPTDKVKLVRAEGYMATCCSLMIQMFPLKDGVMLRTAYDSKIVSSDEAHSFVWDVEMFLHTLLNKPDQLVREVMKSTDRSDNSKRPAFILPATSEEEFELEPNTAKWMIRRLITNIFLAIWFNLLLKFSRDARLIPKPARAIDSRMGRQS